MDIIILVPFDWKQNIFMERQNKAYMYTINPTNCCQVTAKVFFAKHFVSASLQNIHQACQMLSKHPKTVKRVYRK